MRDPNLDISLGHQPLSATSPLLDHGLTTTKPWPLATLAAAQQQSFAAEHLARATLTGPIHSSFFDEQGLDEAEAQLLRGVEFKPTNLHPDQQERLQRVVHTARRMVNIAHELKATAKQTQTDGSMLQRQFGDFLNASATLENGGDVIAWVMRQAYVSSNNDMRHYGERVQFFNQIKERIREEITRARVFQSQHQSFGDDGTPHLDQPYRLLDFDVRPQTDSSGHLQRKEPKEGESTTDGRRFEEYIKGLEQLLNSVGDDAQVAQLDVQMMMQKQTQAMQMLSNISKLLHETAMTIIRKVGV